MPRGFSSLRPGGKLPATSPEAKKRKNRQQYLKRQARLKAGDPKEVERVRKKNEKITERRKASGYYEELYQRQMKDPEFRAKTYKRMGSFPRFNPKHPIIAIDGEGINRNDGRHELIYLAAVSEDGKVWELWKRGRRLTTRQCLSWLVYELPKSATKVFFSGGYDWTHILLDIERKQAKLLMHPEKRQDEQGQFEPVTLWFDQKTTYIYENNKLWGVEESGQKYHLHYLNGMYSVNSQCYWDVYKFYQQSFLTAIEKWGVATEEELPFIDKMKHLRASFNESTWAEIGEVIRQYCRLECSLLTRLVRKLIDASEAEGLRLKGLYGAGSMAGALMNKHKVEQFNGSDRWANGPTRLIDMAYFGGRFDVRKLGRYKNIHEYDIRSAYPNVMQYLPCLAHGRWEKDYDKPSLLTLNVCKFDFPSCKDWGVLPFRNTKSLPRRIHYVASGAGAYWQLEIDAARLWQQAGDRLGIMERWTFVPGCEHRPFSWVPSVYNDRLALDSQGNTRGIILKLGLNAGYGKTADTVSLESPLASMVWAGLTTSAVRAQLMEAALIHREHLIAMATDALYFDQETPGFDIGNQLGQWDHKVHDELLWIKNGVVLSEHGVTGSKYRGINRRAFEEVIESIRFAWDAGAQEITVPFLRHIGLLAASNSESQWEHRGQWLKMEARHRFDIPSRHKSGKPRRFMHWSAPYEKKDKLLELYRIATSTDDELIVEDGPRDTFFEDQP